MWESILMNPSCQFSQHIKESSATAKLEPFRDQTHLQATIRFKCRVLSTTSNIIWKTVRQIPTSNKWTRRNTTSSNRKQSRKRRSLYKRAPRTRWRKARSYSTNQAINWVSLIHLILCWMLKVRELEWRIWRGKRRRKLGLRVTRRWSSWWAMTIYRLGVLISIHR